MSAERVNFKKCKQGLDGINAEFVIEIEELKHFASNPEFLENDSDNTIVRIECIGGKVKSYINIVHWIRLDNTVPFGIADAIKLELAKEQVIEFMKSYLHRNLGEKYSDEFIRKMKITSLECNITLPVAGGASPSDVIALFDMAFDNTMVFRKRKYTFGYAKKNTGCLITKPKEYKLKIYDKTEEQRRNGNRSVEKDLLRIEIVFLNRCLRRMYGKDRPLFETLSVRAIEKMCLMYKKILKEDIYSQKIIPFTEYSVAKLLEGLTSSTSGKEISQTVTTYKDMILDIEILRRALRGWYALRGEEDISKQVIRYYRQKKYGLPEGVLKTIEMFLEAAG